MDVPLERVFRVPVCKVILNVLFSFYENLARQEAMASYVRIREVLSLPQESPGRIPINKILNVESSNELMSVLQSVRNDRIILLISHDPIYSESDFIKISI